jgi:TRAP-type mannitol/chloroaromatic compound transport system permease small subunit
MTVFMAMNCRTDALIDFTSEILFPLFPFNKYLVLLFYNQSLNTYWKVGLPLQSSRTTIIFVTSH